MKIPYWKKWLSYVKEIHVESLDSDHNGTLDVSVIKGRYQLCTQNAIYSFDDKYDNFVRGFEKINWKKFEPKNALVLGLGLASIPYILEHTFQKELAYTAVEIDDAVVELASSYTLPRMTSPIEIICTDAYIFVENCRDRYDLILLDIFVSDTIPDKFQSQNFYEMLRNLLSPKSILMANRLAMTNEDRRNSIENFEVFTEVFPDAVSEDVENNFIFFHDRVYLK